MTENSILFKDSKTINNLSSQDDNISILFNASKENRLEELLFNGVSPQETPHKPKHERCNFSRRDNQDATTEKRMCRCMYYYNFGTKSQKDRCKNKCEYKWKWEHADDGYTILDYEVPMTSVTKGLGGVDIVLKDSNGVKFSVEVKPQDSDETIIRMIAEALTYHSDSKFKDDYHPAIAYFPDSSQNIQMELLQDNDELKEILNKYNIAVFEIKVDKDGDSELNCFRFKRIDEQMK